MTLRTRARAVAARLRGAGHEALFAGGCVRDRLRGETPQDFDIATSATPVEVQALFPRTVPVGAAFGVVIVMHEDDSFEVATFREDVGIADGRHPAHVRFADAEADAKRRDFTVNGMFEDPETGDVRDYVGGRRDLKARVIRTIGDPSARFREDYLRLLRAVRFATVLGFRIEPATRRAVRAHADGIEHVSAERIRDELTKILCSGRGGRGLGLLKETGLLDRILPEVAALDGVEQPSRWHPEGDVFTHTRMMLDSYAGGEPAVALAALLHDVGKAPTAETNKRGHPAFPRHARVGADMAVEIMRRLRYSNRVIDEVEELIADHMTWPALPGMREAKRRRYLLRDTLDHHLALHELDCAACHNDLTAHAYALAEKARLDAEPPPVSPLLNGHALQELGFRPGPAMGTILEALVDAQLEGDVADAETARKFILARFSPPDGKPLAEGRVQ
ncbi:MAG: CCA tRNA nucleotidyltransferase [Planctomycetota bacterium]|nr:CCA tRNA nucleotidyltransferase [Planctomycetota bacterium]